MKDHNLCAYNYLSFTINRLYIVTELNIEKKQFPRTVNVKGDQRSNKNEHMLNDMLYKER